MHNSIKKSAIVQSFNKAAHTYNKAASLQQLVGRELLDIIKVARVQPKVIVDLGAGTGSLTMAIKNNFLTAKIFGVDIADNMVRAAQNNFNELDFICADVDQLPLISQSVDMAVSSLMMQWSIDLNITLNEIKRVMIPGSNLFFSTLGPGSLKELKASWDLIDDYQHIHSFMSESDITNCLIKAGFKNIHIRSVNYQRFFVSVFELMLELKKIGAHNLHCNRVPGLVGRKKFRMLQDYYEKFRLNGKLLASYEVYYVSANC